MDKLLHCANEFGKLLNKDYLFTFSNGQNITLYFKPKHFSHLAGLHKITDIKALKTTNGTNIYNQIINGNITYETISSSAKIEEVEGRLNNFYDIDILLFDKVVINFDPKKTPGRTSKLKSDIIFSKEQNNGYIHLCLAKDSKQNLYYPETFLFEESEYYIKNQDTLNITAYNIIERIKKKVKSNLK